MTDVTVLGGGVIGLSIANELARSGASVRVLDRGEFGSEASWAGAGMLPPGNLERATAPEATLRGLSHRLWPELAASLLTETGIDTGYRVSGAIRLADDDLDRDRELKEWNAEGVPTERLEPSEVARLEPGLAAQGKPALYLPGQAQIRNPRYVKALLAACAEQGVELVRNVAAIDWLTEGERITGVQTSNGRYVSDRYCVAAGAWTAGLLQPLGLTLPVRPVRGQIVLLSTIPRTLTRMVEVGPRYLVPRPDDRVLVGATQEEVGFEKRTTAVGIADLLTFAIDLCPALAQATIEQSWAGLRPGSADGLPYLGRCPDFENLFVAAGHFRTGLQMSPGTGRVMRQLLLDQPTDIPLDGLGMTRLVSAASAG